MDPAEDIDLINVAFEQRHLPDDDSTRWCYIESCLCTCISTMPMLNTSVYRFDVPDRLSGLACLQELNPNRTWNFIMVTAV